MYTLGSGNGWRNVGRFDLKSGYVFLQGGVFANGALYWVDIHGRTVFVFDLTEEKFCEYISPPPFPPGCVWYADSIGVLGEVLYYAIKCGFQMGDIRCSEIWLLKGKNDIHDNKEQVEQETLGWSK